MAQNFVGLALAIAVAIALACAPALVEAQSPTLDPSAVAREQAAMHGDRETAIALWATGGILMTAGGFTTIGWAFPGNGIATFLAGIGAATIGFVLLVTALVLDQSARSHRQRLRDAGVTLGPGPGHAGLSVAFAF